MPQTTILLTGFGPFPGMPVNATSILVPRIARRMRSANPALKVHSAILPTQWQRGPGRATTLIERLRPNLVLHFGVSAAASGFVIERLAARHCRAYLDAIGQLPSASSLSGPPSCKVSLPWDAIVARLQDDGLPVAVSDDAGGYLCNHVLYNTLNLPDAIRPRMAGFIHIPASLAGHGDHGRKSAPSAPLTQAQAVIGAAAIIEVCLVALSS